MQLPIWVMCLIIVIIIAITFLVLGDRDHKKRYWERKSEQILSDAGYGHNFRLLIVESDQTYVTGRRNGKGHTISAKIYLCTKNKYGRSYGKNTIMSALIHELAHIVQPSAGHDDAAFIETMERLAVSAQKFSSYDPFSPTDSSYPCVD
jgi:hypothetical protein